MIDDDELIDNDELIGESLLDSYECTDDYEYRDEPDEEVIFWTPPKENPPAAAKNLMAEKRYQG